MHTRRLIVSTTVSIWKDLRDQVRSGEGRMAAGTSWSYISTGFFVWFWIKNKTSNRFPLPFLTPSMSLSTCESQGGGGSLHAPVPALDKGSVCLALCSLSEFPVHLMIPHPSQNLGLKRTLEGVQFDPPNIKGVQSNHQKAEKQIMDGALAREMVFRCKN